MCDVKVFKTYKYFKMSITTTNKLHKNNITNQHDFN